MLGLARLTGWNIGCELGVNVVLALGIFAVIVRQIKITERNLGVRELRWAIPVSSVIVFSIAQYQNWLWGWQMQMLLNVLAALGGIVLLANRAFSWRRFTASALLGIVATHSFANGMTFWPVGFLILFIVTIGRQERRASLAGWMLVSALAIWSYLWRYQAPKGHAPYQLIFEHPFEYASYVLKYLGSIGAQYSNGTPFGVGDGDLAFVFGFAAVAGGCWTAWLLVRWKVADFNALAPYFGMSLYSISSALVTGLGRLCLGTDQAASSRYCTMVVPLWTSLVVFLFLLAKGKPKLVSPDSLEASRSKRPLHEDCRTIAGWSLIGVICLLTLGSVWATEAAKGMSRTQAYGRACLLDLATHPKVERNYEGLYALHDNPEVVLQRYPILLKWRLSVFRGQKD
jgi:hypothetical protein